MRWQWCRSCCRYSSSSIILARDCRRSLLHERRRMFVGGVVVWRLIVAGIGHRSYSGIRRGDGYVDVLRCAQRESGRPQFLVDERAAHPESSFCFSTSTVPRAMRTGSRGRASTVGLNLPIVIGTVLPRLVVRVLMPLNSVRIPSTAYPYSTRPVAHAFSAVAPRCNQR